MRIAINGVGIAGPTLAYWLHLFGHEPVLIERAPHLRKGGYLIDFWGIGYDIAEKMGLAPELKERDYFLRGIRWVNARGDTSATFLADTFRQITHGRYLSLERSELAESIYNALEGKVETIFGDSVAGIDEMGNEVHVRFEHEAPRTFDLVVGADGLHSRVRELAFGPIEQFEKDLGLRIAAFEVEDYQPRDEGLAVSHTMPGRQIMRVAKHSNKTLFLLSFQNRFEIGDFPTSDNRRKAILERAFEGVEWEWPQILTAMRGVEDIYYDRVSQIHMSQWTKGRTALVGDAAACVSLLAGEGTGLAMAEAYVLAGELSRQANDHTAAFKCYENRLMPFIEGKQESAREFASTFMPNTRFGILFRNFVTRLLPGSFVAKLGLGNLVDDIELPRYEEEFQSI